MSRGVKILIFCQLMRLFLKYDGGIIKITNLMKKLTDAARAIRTELENATPKTKGSSAQSKEENKKILPKTEEALRELRKGDRRKDYAF